jgi:hypothetical protein
MACSSRTDLCGCRHNNADVYADVPASGSQGQSRMSTLFESLHAGTIRPCTYRKAEITPLTCVSLLAPLNLMPSFQRDAGLGCQPGHRRLGLGNTVSFFLNLCARWRGKHPYASVSHAIRIFKASGSQAMSCIVVERWPYGQGALATDVTRN